MTNASEQEAFDRSWRRPSDGGVKIIDWLLDADPAIRWQALRDLADTSPAVIAAERARVPREGVGAAILGSQGSDGCWHRPGVPDWLPTVYTLQLLRATGADPADPLVAAAVARVGEGFRWHEVHGGKPLFEGEVEPCLNGGALAIGSYFGRASGALAQRLLGEQLDDGGWNCDAPKSTRSSYHTTICVLEGLLEYERATEFTPQVTAARRRAEEYLLRRALFRRLSTGEVAHPGFLNLAYPPRYAYDILRALDYFRSTGRAPDPRLSEALGVLKTKRQADGWWLLDATYPESLAVSLGESIGQPSRWNTLRALRVLRWYEGRA